MPGSGPLPSAGHARVRKLVGEKPLWAGFYATYDDDRRAFIVRSAPRRRYGFRVKVLWIVAPGTDQPPTITGTNLETGAPVHFSVQGLGVTTVATLGPGRGVSETAWGESPSYLYFDRAGCFELNTESADRSWRLVFGLGRR